MKKTILITISLLFSIIAYGQDGTLDTSFDTDGIVTTSISGSENFGKDIAIQTDGKIIAVGYTLSNLNEDDFAVVRYNPDGSLDLGFGTNGISVTSVGSKDDQAFGVAIQSDGKIVVAGYTTNGTNNNDFAVVRYNTDGSLDNTFDDDGIVTTIVSSIMDDDIGYDVAIQSDGKIVVVGVSDNGSNDDFAVVRYNTDGSLDSTFNTNGIVLTDFSSRNDEAHSIEIQSDGKIVVAGNATDADGHRNYAAVRYNSTGTLDISNFGTDGKVTTLVGIGYADARSVAIQSDGKIVVAGDAYCSDAHDDIAIVRYESNGVLDPSFGTSGVVYADIGAVNTRMHGDGLAIQLDGKIVVVGEINDRGGDITVVRYDTNGLLDLSFGGIGYVTTDITPNSTEDGLGIAIQADGKIVVVGNWFNSSLKHVFTVLRYNSSVYSDVNDELNSKLEYRLAQNYPNPFNPTTQISFTIEKSGVVKLTIYNILGKEVVTLFNESMSAGVHSVSFNASNLPSGIYFYSISVNGFTKVKKMNLIK